MRGGDRILVAILRGQLRQISRASDVIAASNVIAGNDEMRPMRKHSRSCMECLYTKIQNTKTRAIIKV